MREKIVIELPSCLQTLAPSNTFLTIGPISSHSSLQATEPACPNIRGCFEPAVGTLDIDVRISDIVQVQNCKNRLGVIVDYHSFLSPPYRALYNTTVRIHSRNSYRALFRPQAVRNEVYKRYVPVLMTTDRRPAM